MPDSTSSFVPTCRTRSVSTDDIFDENENLSVADHIAQDNLSAIRSIFENNQSVSLFQFSANNNSSAVILAAELKRPLIVTFLLEKIDQLLITEQVKTDRTILLINKAVASEYLLKHQSIMTSSQCYQEALECDPNQPLAYFYYGLYLIKTIAGEEQLQDALRQFNFLIEQQTVARITQNLLSAVYLNRGITHAKQKNYGFAINDMKQSIQINAEQDKGNRNELAYFNLGILYLKTKQFDWNDAFNKAKTIYEQSSGTVTCRIFESNYNALIEKLIKIKSGVGVVQASFTPDLILEMLSKLAEHEQRLDGLEQREGKLLAQLADINNAIYQNSQLQIDFSVADKEKLQDYKSTVLRLLTESYEKTCSSGWKKTVGQIFTYGNWGANLVQSAVTVYGFCTGNKFGDTFMGTFTAARAILSAPITQLTTVSEKHRGQINELYKQFITLIVEKITVVRKDVVSSVSDAALLATSDAEAIIRSIEQEKIEPDQLLAACDRIVV